MFSLKSSAIFSISAIVLLSFIPPVTRKFIDPANMDLSVKPGDNFFLYANGNWIKNNPVPPSKTRWGSFNILREDNTRKLHMLLEESAAGASTNSKFQKVGDFYTSGMDTANIEKLGYDPIKTDLDRISKLSSVNDVTDEMAYERVNGITEPLISVYVVPDKKNTNTYIAQLEQIGLGLPDRDYYLKGDARSTGIREKYTAYIQHLFQMTGSSDADSKTKADAILSLETALAKAHMSRTEARNVTKTYNKFSWESLSATTPDIHWKSLAQKMNVTNVDSVVVQNPSFEKTIDSLLVTVPVTNWKAYLQWNVMDNSVSALSSAFVNEDFKINQVLTGQKEITPRWERISNQIDASLGDLLGELYVNKYFTADAKKRMLEMINNLQQVFAERIKRLDWMDDSTKQKAIEKLAAITKKIGYADKWLDYSNVVIKKDDYLGNRRRASIWAYNEMLSQLGKQVDKAKWNFTPPAVSASYNPSINDITFPAGILQYPFFDFDADDAINYGAIGCVIGHEMTHGFDDQGRHYDLNGNLKEWWSPGDADKFKTKTDALTDEYAAFKIQDSLHVNGKLTLGENIADLGGINIAYEAFSKTHQFKENKKIEGFTPAQRFFLSYAQIWRVVILPADEANRLIADPHSPNVARVNEPLRNMDAWYAAFNIQPGDKLYKAEDKRIKIW